jgi:hypothetical protein
MPNGEHANDAKITDAKIDSKGLKIGAITTGAIKCHSFTADILAGGSVFAPVHSLDQLATRIKDAADRHKKTIASVLDDIAHGKITINDARQQLGLPTIDLAIYKETPSVGRALKTFEEGVQFGKNMHGQRAAYAMHQAFKGEFTPNEALNMLDLPPINDPRMDKKLVPAPEPPVKPEPPVRPDIYISKGDSRYEMAFHSGAFRGVRIEIMDNQTAEMMEETILRAIAAYWDQDQDSPALVAYDPWGVTGNMRDAITGPAIGAVPMKPGDAFNALENK